MDLIQAFLVTSGRKDLAQDYFQKLAKEPLLTKEEWQQRTILIQNAGGLTKTFNFQFLQSYEKANELVKELLAKNNSYIVFFTKKPTIDGMDRLSLSITELSNITVQTDYENIILRKRIIKSSLVDSDIYKTKSYEELVKLGEDVSTSRKLKNGSVDIKIGKDTWQLNNSGKLVRLFSIGPPLKTIPAIKTAEEWEFAWSWLLNYLPRLNKRRETAKENFESNKQEWKDLVKEINFPDEFLSKEDFTKIDNFLESYDEKKLESDRKIAILGTILQHIGNKIIIPPDVYYHTLMLALLDNFPPTEKEYRKSINKYFDLTVKGDTRITAYLHPTQRFDDLVKNRKKKIGDNFWRFREILGTEE